MAHPLYQATVPVYRRTLTNLSAILEKAEAYAAEKKVDPAVLLSSRLFPDMFPLVRQVQNATDHAKGSVSRLAQVENPKFPDTETTFPELRERIGRLLFFIGGVALDSFEGSESRELQLRVSGEQRTLRGDTYLFHVALPNFFFHVTTAYGILRHNGLTIGKADYIGRGDF